jgi:hypothetical protein
MNKIISFKDLIDLEPKPKIVKCDEMIFELTDGRGFYNEMQRLELQEYINFTNMNKQNIEIIEEDKPLIERLKLKHNTNDMVLEQHNKLHEIIDYINKKEKGE